MIEGVRWTLTFVLHPEIDRNLLPLISEASINQNDVSAIFQLIAVVFSNPKTVKNELGSLFLPLLQYLTERNEARWIHEIWSILDLHNSLRMLEEDQVLAVLDNLVFLKEIDFHAEIILKTLAENFPTAVIKLFGKRLEKAGDQEAFGERYEAIPFEFHELQKSLSAIPIELTEIIFEWYKSDSNLFQFRGANLIKNTFPDFNSELEAKLIEIIQKNGENAAYFITSILRNYEGQEFLHGVCKQLIKSIPDNSKYLGEIRIVLEESGTVMGEFGFVELYEQKKQEVFPWLEDGNSKIKNFAGVYTRELDRQIAAEQRRAEEEVEIRKHRFGK